MTKSSLMNIEIRRRDETKLATLHLSGNETLANLKKEFYKSDPRYHTSRQYFTIGKDTEKIALKNDTKNLFELGIQDDFIVLYFKDLGPQIEWRTVFIIEYFGPLFVHFILFFFPQFFYVNSNQKYSLVQKLAFGLAVIHFMKREFETLFIHRFSTGTMPMRNLFKNSLHYWVFGGVFIAYPLYHPNYTNSLSNATAILFSAAFMVCMMGNFICHLILRNLRPVGTRTRRIPRGFLFEYVSCPNYFFEMSSWMIYAFLTQCASAWFFAFLGAAQMSLWAVSKHKNYHQEFNGENGREIYPRSRKILVPLMW